MHNIKRYLISKHVLVPWFNIAKNYTVQFLHYKIILHAVWMFDGDKTSINSGLADYLSKIHPLRTTCMFDVWRDSAVELPLLESKQVVMRASP